MIEINLIPVNQRKKDSGASQALVFLDLPKEFVLGCSSLFIFVLIAIHLVLLGIWFTKSARLKIAETQWQNMSTDKKSLDLISKNIKESKAKIVMINDNVTKKSLMWSQKLNILSDSMPKGVWFRKISYSNNSLTIEGNAYSKAHDEIATIGNFVSNLKKDTVFIKDFESLELNTITRVKKNETEIADFSITAKGKEIFSSTPANKKAKK